MKLIELSKNGIHKGKYFAQVDDGDYEYLSQFSWHVKFKGKTIYAERVVYDNGKRVGSKKMHNDILQEIKGHVTDHRDRNGLNNQRYNLRKCTQKNNSANKVTGGKGSKYNGVSFRDGYWYKTNGNRKYCENKKKWVAQIGFMGGDGKALGYFSTEKEAAKAYNDEAIKRYGEFANLNVID